MANVTLEQLEDAVLGALEDLSYLRTRKAYQGELDIESADELSVQWPAALVFLESITFTPGSVDATDYLSRPLLAIFVGDVNWRGEKDARRGGVGSDVGTYRMIRDVVDRLAGQTFDLSIGPLVPREVRSVLSLATPPASVYRITFEFSDVDYAAAP